MDRARIAIVSPFVDKRHGTERHLAEWIPRLAEHYEIYLYSQRVEDVDLAQIKWRRVPSIPGPHLTGYLFWFAANHLYRWWDRLAKGLKYELVFSPGINCLDAKLISVHVVFADLYQAVNREGRSHRRSLGSWPTMLHRRLYYRLIMSLERMIYRKRTTQLVAISGKTAADLSKFYGTPRTLPISYAGVDGVAFNQRLRLSFRNVSRKKLGLASEAFVLLLIGNAWDSKGLPTALRALHQLDGLPAVLLVAGKDDSRPFQSMIRQYGLDKRVIFLPHRPDVIAYYAACDAYIAPSLGEAFAQPVAEAMACGLPVIASASAGVSEIITHGVDGLILNNPRDAGELAGHIQSLYDCPLLRERLGSRAAVTTQKYTWDHSASQLIVILDALTAHQGQLRSAVQPVS